MCASWTYTIAVHAAGRLEGQAGQPRCCRDAIVPDSVTIVLQPWCRFKTDEEAIAMGNDTQYGLAAYFFSKDLKRVWTVASELEYGARRLASRTKL